MAGRGQPTGGVSREPRGLLVERRQLTPAPRGALEVIPEDLRVFAGTFADVLLNPPRKLLVECGAVLLEELLVGHVAHQDVGEVERGLPTERVPPGCTRPFPTRAARQVPSSSGTISGIRCAERCGPELLTHQGGSLQHLALIGLEPIEAGAQQSLDRRRDRHLANSGARPQLPSSRQGALVDQHTQQLLEEQGVSLCQATMRSS